jgi:tetratricopeptide (TPR) repeat protein
MVKRFTGLLRQSSALLAGVLISTVSGFPSASAARAGEVNRLLFQGAAEVRQDRFDQAIRTFSAALQLNPDSRMAAELHGERGGAYVDKGDLSKAMADAEEAVRLAPNHFRGYQVRGRVYRHRKQFDRSMREFNTALRLAPNFAQLYNNRGNLFSDKGQEQRAIQDYSEAIRREPRAPDGYINRGGSYAKLGELDKGIADQSEAIRIDPRSTHAHLNRAMMLAKKREYRLAIADYEKANTLSPRDPATLNSLAWLKATCPVDSVRDGKQAVAAALEACRLTRFQEANKVDTLGAAYAEAGDFEHAIEFVTKALELKPEPKDRKEIADHLVLYRARKPVRNLH